MPAVQDLPADGDLMRQLCVERDERGANAVFSQIFERYHRRVVSWCFNLTRDREASPDLAQEILLKAYRYRHSWRGDSRLSTWLYAITRNHCLSAIKKRMNAGGAMEATLSPRLRDASATPPDVAAERRQMYAFSARLLMRSLDPVEARVMALHYGFGVSLGEITEQLGLRNPSGAKAYIVNARRKLKSKLRRCGVVSLTPRR